MKIFPYLAIAVPAIAFAQTQPPAPVQEGHPVIIQRSVTETPALVVSPPAVRDSSGNAVTSSGAAVTSSASPVVRQGVLVHEQERVLVPEASSSTGASVVQSADEPIVGHPVSIGGR